MPQYSSTIIIYWWICCHLLVYLLTCFLGLCASCCIEYNTIIWSSATARDIDVVESVQRRFTKRLPTLNNLSYIEWSRVTSRHFQRQESSRVLFSTTAPVLDALPSWLFAKMFLWVQGRRANKSCGGAPVPFRSLHLPFLSPPPLSSLPTPLPSLPFPSPDRKSVV